MMEKYTLVPDILRAKAEECPDNCALEVIGVAAMTYREWEARSNALGQWVHRNTDKQSRVGLMFSNRDAIDNYTAYFAAQKAGCIPFPINIRMADAELKHIIQHAEPVLIFCAEEFAARLQKIKTEQGFGFQICSAERIEQAIADEDTATFQIEVDPESPADILYTSGTTGLPKGVETPHSNINFWDDESMGQYFPSMPGAKTLNAIPIFTFAGVHGMMLFNLRNSLHHHILPSFDAQKYLQTIAEKKIMLSYIVPAMAELILQLPPPYPDLTSLKLLTFGTAPMKPKTILSLRQLLPQTMLANVYGLTEGGTSACANFFYPGEPEETIKRKLKTVGQPIAPTKVKILDKEGNSLPPNKLGEIVFEHPAQPRKYFKNREQTGKVWRERGANRIYTGDLGYLDQDGNLVITDRKKELIIRGGFNIFPSEVEEVLRQHPHIQDVAIVGIEHKILGEDCQAFVICKPNKTISLSELQDFAKEKLSDYKIPRHLTLVDSFPRSEIGKVLKRKLKEQSS